MEVGKVVAVVPFWQRPNVSRIFWENIKLQQDHMDLEVVAIVSEHDNKKLAKKHTPHVIQYPNRIIGEKWNAGVQHAKHIDFTHMMILGSDDIFSHKLIELYAREVRGYLGLKDATAISLASKKCRYWVGYPSGVRRLESVGSGRFLSRGIVEKAGFNLFGSVNQSIDRTMTKRLQQIGVRNEMIRTGFGALRLGLKTPDSIGGMFGQFNRPLPEGELEAIYGKKIHDMIMDW